MSWKEVGTWREDHPFTRLLWAPLVDLLRKEEHHKRWWIGKARQRSCMASSTLCTVNRFAKFKENHMGKGPSVYFFSLLMYHNHHQGSHFLSGKRYWQGRGWKSSCKTPRNYGTLIKESKDNVFQTTWKTEKSILVMLLCFLWCVNNCNEGPQQLWTGVECFCEIPGSKRIGFMGSFREVCALAWK